MRIYSISIFSGILSAFLFSQTAQAKDFISLQDYKCSQFLTDVAARDSGEKVVRSMMMISWAAGYAAAHQSDAPKADVKSIQLVAAAIGTACRQAPSETVVQVTVSAIERLIESQLKSR